MNEPLIYTSRGNLPVASLQYRYQWLNTENDITFTEEYLLNGEVVKRNSHCCLKKGIDAGLQQAVFG